MAKLSTHVLDTMRGKPSEGLVIHLYQIFEDGDKTKINSIITNKDGRCDAPLLDKQSIRQVTYELVFEVESYFHKHGVHDYFFKEIVIRFYIENSEENYHIPLLLSPYGYSTYRGS